MYALFFTSKTNAVAIAFLKGLFAFATKGIVAGLLSFFGSILSVSIMMLLIFLFKDNISYLILSISGAVFHNIGQIIGVCIIYKGLFFLTYTPVLIIAGTVAGIVTATILRVVLPAIKQINT
jgi:heptaprenyl diphosphate synthase